MEEKPRTGRDIGITDGPFADAEIVSSYSRAQAIEDGVLVDVSEWARGFGGSMDKSVVFTQALWAEVEIPVKQTTDDYMGDTRGRAHDVLFCAACKLTLWQHEQGREDVLGGFTVRLGKRNHHLWAVVDGDGVTIGYPEDF